MIVLRVLYWGSLKFSLKSAFEMIVNFAKVKFVFSVPKVAQIPKATRWSPSRNGGWP